MDWVGWVGLDLRVGGGIEHLTVLINVVQSRMMMIWVTSTSMVIHVFQSRIQKYRNTVWKYGIHRGHQHEYGGAGVEDKWRHTYPYVPTRFLSLQDSMVIMMIKLEWEWWWWKFKSWFFSYTYQNPAPRPPPESIGEIMMMMRRRRRRGMRRRRSRIVMGMVMSA